MLKREDGFVEETRVRLVSWRDLPKRNMQRGVGGLEEETRRLPEIL